MDSAPVLIVPLTEASRHDETFLGGKAVSLGRLIDAGFRVPDGFCISTKAYERFVKDNEIEGIIRMELGRKPFASMRWEEIWDVALRIRSAFLGGVVHPDLAGAIVSAGTALGASATVVRSSAPGEDSAGKSYAGLHESLVGVAGEEALIDAVRVVWASLWSDAALLYRQELGMDPRGSRMAVVVQSLVAADTSGVGFGIDPREPRSDREIVEAVPGLCEDLVAGAVDPDRWIMKRSSGEVIEFRPGQRGEASSEPILARDDLDLLHETLQSVEAVMGWPADVEWTGKSSGLTLLQARPVTQTELRDDDERQWYLTLRPGKARLGALCTRVTEVLIPELEANASRLAAESIERHDDLKLADAIEERDGLLKHWKRVYWDEFIPFAHGVRQLGLYYNDAVRPDDPYEFVGLLKDQPMIASQRNAALERLAAQIRQHDALRARLQALLETGSLANRGDWEAQATSLPVDATSSSFAERFSAFLDEYMNITFDGEALDDRPDLVLRTVLELALTAEHAGPGDDALQAALENRLIEAVGPDREEEARDVLRIARLSWRLRDDDNILIGRLENQLQRALNEAAGRLRAQSRLTSNGAVGNDVADLFVNALRHPKAGTVTIPDAKKPPTRHRAARGEKPRQLIGQPASPGAATGRARIVRSAEDMGSFSGGEIIICDAIQPTMTHLLPLAAGVVERRGGMLIHGAIIARELGIPCVNGVPDATDELSDGELVTVDGYNGIVTVGPPEFDLELGEPNTQ